MNLTTRAALAATFAALLYVGAPTRAHAEPTPDPGRTCADLLTITRTNLRAADADLRAAQDTINAVGSELDNTRGALVVTHLQLDAAQRRIARLERKLHTHR